MVRELKKDDPRLVKLADNYGKTTFQLLVRWSLQQGVVTIPKSVKRDRFQKRSIYERFAVPEYWIADPQNQEIEVYTLSATGHYELFSIATVQDLARGEGFMLTSGVLPDLKSTFVSCSEVGCVSF